MEGAGRRREARAWALLVPGGLAIGFLGSLCGIGGGLFAMPLLHLARGLALRESIATALILVFATTASATAAEVLRPEPALVLSLVAALVPGVLVGAQLGFRVIQRVRDEHKLRMVFALVLIAAGLRVYFGGEGAAVASAEVSIGPPELLGAFAVGIAGGFVIPVLGVGGGLVTAPGLYLLIAGLGFDAARACSLAGGAIGSLRSLWLHGRAGRVRWSAGAPLGLGALAGAQLGVFALGYPGWIELGRGTLGVVLVGVGLRFAWEVRRGRSAEAQA